MLHNTLNPFANDCNWLSAEFASSTLGAFRFTIKLLGIKSIARLEAAVVGISLYEYFAEGAVMEALVETAGFVGYVLVVA